MPEIGRIRITHELPELGATAAIGETIGRSLRGGDVLALAGEMGAGKTTLVRSIASAMGIDSGEVSSPTFLVVAEHVHPEPAKPDLVHVDAYRLGGADELDSLGWDRFEGDGMASRVLIAEWPDRIAEALDDLAGESIARVSLEITGRSSRRIVLDLPERWLEREAIEAMSRREPIRCRSEGVWVSPDNPAWPFSTARAQQADLYKWFAGDYRISRDMSEADLEQGE